MKKNWIVWLLCTALFASALTGCSSGKAAEPLEDAVEETVEESAEEPEETVEEPAEQPENEETGEEESAQIEQEEEAGQQTAAETKPEEPAPQQTPSEPAGSAPAEEPAPAPEEPAAEEPAPQGIADGTYTISIGFSGGTGKASITSPVTLYVKNGTYTAKVVWTSVNYDYMKVNGVKYLNENNGGNSTFTIPVPALDTYFTVIGDTLAMSSPHEIEYTLYFDSTTLH